MNFRSIVIAYKEDAYFNIIVGAVLKGARISLVFFAKKHTDKAEMKKYLEKKFHCKFQPLDALREGYVFDSRASYSVPPAIEAFLESDSYESAIRKAISIGG